MEALLNRNKAKVILYIEVKLFKTLFYLKEFRSIFQYSIIVHCI